MSEFKVSKAMLTEQSHLTADLSKFASEHETTLEKCKEENEAIKKLIDDVRERITYGAPDHHRDYRLPAGRKITTDLAGLYLEMAESVVNCDIALLNFNDEAEKANQALVDLSKMVLTYRAERGDEKAARILSDLEEHIANETGTYFSLNSDDDEDEDSPNEETNN